MYVRIIHPILNVYESREANIESPCIHNLPPIAIGRCSVSSDLHPSSKLGSCAPKQKKADRTQ